MGKFAKLFDLENDEQVLITLGLNEEEQFELSVKTDFEGVVIEMKFGFDIEEAQLSAFDRFSTEQAINHRKYMQDLVE